ncbi:hypothetical protein Tco_0891357 [Tanacetum coccineum]|uniref:Uncharacterized protein n=1 Tax=Tanacetum coccineum TaxID=301880 RepID=A0ABQ5C2P5_9ASTR
MVLHSHCFTVKSWLVQDQTVLVCVELSILATTLNKLERFILIWDLQICWVFFGWLASIKQRILEPVKVKCIFLGYRKGIVGNKLWRLDDVTSKVVLYRNMGFNESGKYKETFIGPGVFGLHKVQTLDLIDYHSTDDREKLSAQELFRYRKDNIDVAFVWNARLKEDMDSRSDVYVLNASLRSGLPRDCWEAKENILSMKIFKNQSGNTLRVSQSRVYNGKLVSANSDSKVEIVSISMHIRR